jgi:hypothetical protein
VVRRTAGLHGPQGRAAGGYGCRMHSVNAKAWTK